MHQIGCDLMRGTLGLPTQFIITTHRSHYLICQRRAVLNISIELFVRYGDDGYQIKSHGIYMKNAVFQKRAQVLLC